MGRRILFPYMEKVMYMSTKTIEIEWSDQYRANATTDSSRHLLLTYVCTNISWTSSGVALLVSVVILGKSLQMFLYFLKAS